MPTRPTDLSPLERSPPEPSTDELADLVVARPRPVLVGLDVDGVLAPIVDRADRAVLLPGVAEALVALIPHVTVAVVSGRSVADLDERYGFPPSITVVGSHGLETRHHEGVALDAEERHRLDDLTSLAAAAAAAAGEGAWIEHKPASIVLHVREADAGTAGPAVAQLHERASTVPGAHLKRGHEVVELMARHTSKAAAVAELRAEHGVRTVVFVGDDHTDEEVFA
ncbi:MAG: trehalose-phosphatase, partial [Ilumatobacteraceae bacterium]